MPRPREFDKQAVVAQAMKLFWRQGYEATSIDDLLEEMSISRSSLYGTFGNKYGVFLAALDRYLLLLEDEALALLADPDASVAEIATFLNGFVERAARPGAQRHGCLMCNTAVEMPRLDAQADRRFDRFRRRLQGAFRHALGNAAERNEIDSTRNLDDAADLLTAVVIGMSVTARTDAAQSFYAHSVRAALRGLRS